MNKIKTQELRKQFDNVMEEYKELMTSILEYQDKVNTLTDSKRKIEDKIRDIKLELSCRSD